MGIVLMPHQEEALERMKNGCILNGGTGSGKSLTAVAYYFFKNGGIYSRGQYIPIPDDGNIPDLYIITTAKKRDNREWDHELSNFLLSQYPDMNMYSNKVVVDSWNNLPKYKDVKNAFFIFDEQRVVGRGEWAKTFIRLARTNEWILLTATPGDSWNDYVPVFIANGFFKNRTQFNQEHVIFKPFTKYPQIQGYRDTGKLIKMRDAILIDMDFKRHTVQHHENVLCNYPIFIYKDIHKTRWNYEKDCPINSANELCYELRRVVNSDPSRLEKVLDIFKEHKHIIIFYNFDYELELLKKTLSQMRDLKIAEWNGHKHQEIPKSENWIYLVQYTAGCEGWNCITTDTIIFYSQNYSYKVTEQAVGRIDRLNTPFTDLYYYHLKSKAPIDLAIGRALSAKKKFNESSYVHKKYSQK